MMAKKAVRLDSLDVETAALMLGVSERIIRMWIAQRGMPVAFRFRESVTLNWEAIFKWFMRMRRDELITDRKRRVTPQGTYCPACGRV